MYRRKSNVVDTYSGSSGHVLTRQTYVDNLQLVWDVFNRYAILYTLWIHYFHITCLMDRSTEMQIAVEHITTALIRPGLVRKGQPHTAVECSAPLRSFIRCVVRNLMVSGYAAYKASPVDDETGMPIFQCAPGESTLIEFDWDERVWKARNAIDGNQAEDDDEFDVIVFCEPKTRNPDSYAWAARHDAIILDRLHRNFLIRDCSNSRS